MKHLRGETPSGSFAAWLRDAAIPLIAGGESQPGETPPPSTPPATPPATPPTTDPEPFDRDRAMRTIEALRQEAKDAKALKKQVDDLAAQLKARDDEKLSETEKLTKKVADLEAAVAARDTERKALLIRSEVERQARLLGIVDEDAAYRLLDLAAVELDADGKPQNIEKLLKALLEAKPYLKATTETTRPGIPGTPRGNGNPAADKVTENRQKLAATGAYARF